MTKSIVPADVIAAFERDGAVALKGYFADWVEVLRAGIARNMAEPSADVKIYKGKDGGGRFFGDYCNWERIPEYKDFIFNSPAAEIGRQLMGSENGAAVPRACAGEGGECRGGHALAPGPALLLRGRK